jgi:hemerythrin-like domain-containing protein
MNQTTDPVQMLKQDHEKVKQLFKQFQQGGDPQQKQQIADQIFMELEVHASIEEEIFYPALRSQGDAEDKELVAEAYEEHAGAKELIQQMRGMQAGDAQYDALMQQLQQDIEHHVEEEEGEMLPKAEQELSGQLDRLGQEMMQRKQQMMSQMQGTMGGSQRTT